MAVDLFDADDDAEFGEAIKADLARGGAETIAVVTAARTVAT